MRRTRTQVADLLTPRLLFLLVERGQELDLRPRRSAGSWRFRCPADSSHDVTLVNGTPGLALTCHGPRGQDGVGHSIVVHQRAASEERWFGRLEWLEHGPFPCRFCGCLSSQVIAALEARGRDCFPSPADGTCSVRSCPEPGRLVGRSILCLGHLADRAQVPREVLFEPPA